MPVDILNLSCPGSAQSSFSEMLGSTHLHSFPSGSLALQTTGLYCWPSLTGEWNWQLFHHGLTSLTSKWPVPLNHAYICGECCVFYRLRVHAADHLFYLTSLHSSLPQLCKHTRPLCIFVLLFLLTLLRSVLINHPWVVRTAHIHTHIYAHTFLSQSFLNTPTFHIQGLLLKQSGAF